MFLAELGFSFVVGLAIGFALKTAFKIAFIVGGIVLVALFALQYGGLIQIDWTGMEAQYGSILEWLQAYGGSLRIFMANHLPQTASFGVGFLVGFRI